MGLFLPYDTLRGKSILWDRRPLARMQFFTVLLFALTSVASWGQTIFTENMGSPSGTTAISSNTFQNSTGSLTYDQGSATNPADVRSSTASTSYTGASGGGNVWFTTTNAQYGFAINGIDASNYTSLQLSYGYYKNSGTAHATFQVDYWNGSSWVNIANTAANLFTESATASTGWYSAKTLSLPVGAQISGLKIRFLKSGSNGIRIDDVKLTGTLPTCTDPTLTTTNFGNKTVNNGDASFTQTITSNSPGAITYSSGTTSVATVNSSTGAVTIVAPGTSIITASQAASGSYCAATATYTLTVNSTTPSVSATGTLVAVPTTYGTASSNTTFTASGANLTAPIIITAPSGYEISTASASGFGSSVSLTPTSGTVSATTIYVRIAATTTVGNYSGNITLNSASSPVASTSIATVSSTVSAKALTITGLTGGSKVYDATLTAPVAGTATLNGIVNNDPITLSGTPAYNFTTKAVGTNAINITGLSVTGTNASSYSLTLPSLTGTITTKSVTVTGATAQDKTYNGTTAAVVSGGTVVGAITNDAVSVSTTGTFASANAGTGIGVTIALTGNDATNYSLTQPNITANINKANPTFGTVAISLGVGSTYSLTASSISNSDGTLSYGITNTAIATVSGTTINGIAVGSTILNVNQAASTNYNAGNTSYTVNVTAITYNVGDFRTKTGGTWTNRSPIGTATWQRYTASGWVDAVDGNGVNVEPSGTASSNYTVYITQDVTLPTSTTQNATARLYVTNNATFTYGTSALWTFRNLIIDNGATMEMQTRFTVLSSGNFEIYDGGNFVFNHDSNAGASSSLASSLWNGTEVFHPNSNFYIRNHDTGSGNYLFPADANFTSNTYNGVKAYFGNLIINSSGNEVRLTTTNLSAGSTNLYLTHKNLEFAPTSSYNLFYGGATWNIGGNLVINQPTGTTTSYNLGVTTSAVTITLNVKGNFINNSKNLLRLLNNASANVTFNVDGDITLSDEGKLDLGVSGTSATNVKGDVSVASGALLNASASGATTTFNFTGIGNGSTAATTQTINIATTAVAKNQYVNFASKSGSYVQLANNLTLGTNGKFTTEAGSVFDTQTNVISGPSFVTAATSTVTTNNTGGLTGAITATPTYAAGTHYIFNAATTTPFPTDTFANPANVTTNANVTLNRNIAPTGNVTVNSGIFDLDTYTIDRATSGSIITLGNGATLKINGTNGFPANYASQVFNTNSTVHFAGDNQPVKKLTAEYYNVRLSGTGAKTFDNETIVGNNLTLENGPSVALTANKTLIVRNQLVNNGTAENFTIEDNGALVQTNNVTNSGSITAHKNSNALYRLDYTMWSSPTSGTQTLGQFSPNTTETRFYEYDSRNGGSGFVEAYYHVDPATATFAPAHSYLIRMPNADSTTNYNGGTGTLVVDGKFIGTPNNGTITRALNMNTNKYTSTGNPYPSPIGVSDFFAANSTAIDAGSGIYLWRKKNSGTTGSYATISNASYAFNAENGSTTGGQVNDQYFTGVSSSEWKIAPGQGFIVKTNSTATGNPVVTFNNGMRKNAPGSGGQSFFRVGAQNISRYWINLANDQGNISQFTVAYTADATTGIDYSYDAYRLAESNTFAAYTIAEDKDLIIQARPEFANTDTVKAGYVAPQAGTYTLSLSNKDGVFTNGQAIYIQDNEQNVTRELTPEGYTFSTQAGTFNDRFTIVYTNQALNTNDPVKSIANVTVFKKNSTIVADAGNDIINTIEVFDIQGRVIFSNTNVNATNYSLNSLNASHEMLIVKVSTNKGTVSKKIIF
nr:YDG domain-containing protein [uncultured Flavobacterium sp.]